MSRWLDLHSETFTGFGYHPDLPAEPIYAGTTDRVDPLSISAEVSSVPGRGVRED